ncbi:MAG: hypothetical protein WDW36_002309 [Sanguina aurantia]
MSVIAECRDSTTSSKVHRSPLLDAVKERGDRSHEISLHVPGHKRGRGVSEKMESLTGPTALKYDLTELPGLDYLSSPSGVILDAQRLAATAFGADRTWFLVNGCSVAIHAAVMACAGPGDTLLVARNCHMSAFSAMVISGAVPWWVAPEVDGTHGIAHCVTPQSLRAELDAAGQAGRRVRAVLLVSPTYYGAAARLSELADICHSHHIPLLVDEAHGGHFRFGAEFPPDALSCGADLVMHSTHKSLTAMTQGAMLHLRGPRVSPSRISRALQTLQTSSPSYLLLASLDAATAQAQRRDAFTAPVATAWAARAGLASIPGITLVDASTCQQHLHPRSGVQQHTDSGSSQRLDEPFQGHSTGLVGHSQQQQQQHGGSVVESVVGARNGGSSAAGGSILAFDPLRFAVNVSGLGVSGFQASLMLEEEWGVVSELSTLKLVLFVMGPGTVAADATALVAAFAAMSRRLHTHSTPTPDSHQQSSTTHHPTSTPHMPASSGSSRPPTPSQGPGDAHPQSRHTSTAAAERAPPAQTSPPALSPSQTPHAPAVAPSPTHDSPAQAAHAPVAAGGLDAGVQRMEPVAVGPRSGVAVGLQQRPQRAHTAPAQPRVVLSPRDAFFAPSATVHIGEAVGRTSLQLLCPYPPGVPIVFPGEMITAEAVAQLQGTLACGGTVTGAADGTLKTLEVAA